MTIFRTLSRALLLLAALAVLAPACQRNSSGGGGGDDDDDATDDDDASSDDDDASADDDDAAPEVPCEGPNDEGPEIEPNDSPPSATRFVAGGTLTVTGTTDECANDGKQWTGAADWIANDWADPDLGVEVDCNDTGTVTLSWAGDDDLDLRVWSTPNKGDNDILGNFSDTVPGTDGGEIAVTSGVWFEVLCWEGTPGTEWTLTVTF